MTWAYSIALNNAILDTIDAQLNAGGGAGKWRVYSGTQPSRGAAPSGTLLAEGTFSATALQTASGEVIVFNTINSDASANASGTPTFIRLLDFADTFIMDGTCGSGAGNDAVTDEETITILDVFGWTASESSFTSGNTG